MNRWVFNDIIYNVYNINIIDVIIITLTTIGAITKGDRRAATGADLTQFNFDTNYGRQALKSMYEAIHKVSEGFLDARYIPNFISYEAVARV